jgi:hypothetical protein
LRGPPPLSMEQTGKPAVLDSCSGAAGADVRAEAKRKATAAAREKDDARRAEAALKEKERRDAKKRNPSTSGAVSGMDSQCSLRDVGDGGAGAQRPPQTGAAARRAARARKRAARARSVRRRRMRRPLRVLAWERVRWPLRTRARDRAAPLARSRRRARSARAARRGASHGRTTMSRTRPALTVLRQWAAVAAPPRTRAQPFLSGAVRPRLGTQTACGTSACATRMERALPRTCAQLSSGTVARSRWGTISACGTSGVAMKLDRPTCGF